MRIKVDERCITGYVDYDQRGRETDVISISVGDDELKIQFSMCLPVRHVPAKLVLACFNEAFAKAESMLSAECPTCGSADHTECIGHQWHGAINGTAWRCLACGCEWMGDDWGPV